MNHATPRNLVTLALALSAIGACESGGSEAASTSSSSATSSSSSSSTGGSSPMKPADLVDYVTGDDADADVTPLGPGLILMGGGADVDAAFAWWSPKIASGDVVVLRASGADGYNSYLYADIGGADSVETMLVTTAELANDPYVIDRVTHAEGVFIAGGDQAVYLEMWKGTGLEDALRAAYSRGAILGGTSAGCDVLTEVIYSAVNGSVYSDEALADPFNRYMTLDHDFLELELTRSLVVDTHFFERDRMGRLIGFMARAITDGLVPNVRGLGIDQATALVVESDGVAKVVGSGHVYVVDHTALPGVCVAGQALEWSGLALARLSAGDSITLPLGAPGVGLTSLDVSNGVTEPADPY